MVEADGAEQRRAVEGAAWLAGERLPFRVGAAQFDSLAWVPEQLGASAVIDPVQGSAAHVRAAIGLLSRSVRATVYAHLGWHAVDGRWAYLHAGGAVGGDGPLAGVEVRAPETLAGYVLPSPPGCESQRIAICASLAMRRVGGARVTMPIQMAVYRAPLGAVDFSLSLIGPTTGGKSALAALAQQHYGLAMDAHHLPGGWLSTANALERTAFAAKDALFTVDDWVQAGARQDVERAHRDAARIYRAQGNRSGRARARTDGTVMPARPPRGLLLTTGPRGESVRGRVFWLELSQRELRGLDRDALSECQADAAAGRYAQALAAYIQWIARDYVAITQIAREHERTWRPYAARLTAHPRTADAVSQLATGWHAFLTFARSSGAISSDEVAALWTKGWAALGEAARAQAQPQRAPSRPAALSSSWVRRSQAGGPMSRGGTAPRLTRPPHGDDGRLDVVLASMPAPIGNRSGGRLAG